MSREMRSGFTLIELMVVVVLVMILALAIVPTFKEIITKAKYTEGSAAISALRTKIKVFYVENNRLPGLDPATVAAATPSAQTLCQSLCDKTTGETWDYDMAGAKAAVAGVDMSYLMTDLDIEVGDYAGAYFKNIDYTYYAFNSGMKDSSYGYVVLVAGSGEKKSPPLGTGYAVMEIRNTAWTDNQLVTAVFERYKAESGFSGTFPLYINNTFATSKNAQSVLVPGLWTDVTASLTAAGIPKYADFEAAGWKVQ